MMFAKVKNHATVQRAPDLSAGTSDYIHAGTQVLLNTPSLVLLPHQAPFHYLRPPSFSLSRCSPGLVQVQKLFAVQVPPHVCLPPLVPCSMLRKKANQGDNTNPPKHQAPKPRCHTSLPCFYDRAALVV